MISPRIGSVVGAKVGAAFGSGADQIGGVATWNVDAASGWNLPESSSQWNSFISSKVLSISAPTSLWLMQEASGNLTDTIGGKTLTQSGTAPSYQQAVTGLTRLSVQFTDVINQIFTNTTFANSATTSLWVFAVYFPTAVASTAANGLITYGTGSTQIGVRHLNTDRIQYRNGGTTAAFTSAMSGLGFIGFKHDIANSAARLENGAEKLSPAFAADAGSNFWLGAPSTNSAPCKLAYVAAWSGVSGEVSDANRKATYQALMNISIPWS